MVSHRTFNLEMNEKRRNGLWMEVKMNKEKKK